MNKHKPVLALMYDFDKTLCTKDMQEYSFIPNINMKSSEFLYDENNIACWPKNVVNYTTKTQFLFRINKGVIDISDDATLSKYTPEDKRPVPFRNMIYIGDGLTDVPCMRLVKANGGYSIAVYQRGKRIKVEDLLRYERVDYIVPANYAENSELDKTVRDIVCKMAMTDSLKRKSQIQMDAVTKKLNS